MNKNPIVALAFCFVAVGFISCTKRKLPAINAYGVVTNKLTGAPVKNIPIELRGCEGIPLKCLSTLKTVYTDENGTITLDMIQTIGNRMPSVLREMIA